MDVRARDIVSKFAPNARPEYRQAFRDGDALLDQFGIVTPQRLAHFMAQVFHETGALRIAVESGRYTRNSLGKLWDGGNWHGYFASRDACLAMADQCAVDRGEALFSLVYGNRMGNGPPASRDGWRFRGRGLLQTTGRWSYEKFAQRWNVPFDQDPDLITAPEHALKPALAEWDANILNKEADEGDILTITKRINGGTVGLAERKAWFYKIFPFAQSGLSRAWRAQAALQDLGLLADPPDGIVGRNTRDAIARYRTQKGLPAGTAVDDTLVEALGLADDED